MTYFPGCRFKITVNILIMHKIDHSIARHFWNEKTQVFSLGSFSCPFIPQQRKLIETWTLKFYFIYRSFKYIMNESNEMYIALNRSLLYVILQSCGHIIVWKLYRHQRQGMQPSARQGVAHVFLLFFSSTISHWKLR